MGNAVVGACTGELGIQFTGTVPGAAHGAQSRFYHVVSLTFQPGGGVTGGHAHMWQDLIQSIILAPSQISVNEYHRIVLGRSSRIVSAGR